MYGFVEKASEKALMVLKFDNIDFKIEFSQELKQKIVEIFLMKNII